MAQPRNRDAILSASFLALVGFLLFQAEARAQYQSDDPSDATTTLVNAGTASTVTTICTGGSETTGLTLAGNTNTTAVPAPPCGTFSGSTRDVWVRLDVPASGDWRYRFTVSGDGSPALSDGAMAAYTATSASGPFSFLDCAIGGNSGQFNNPSLEVTCIPPGSKIYLRIWDEITAASNNNFKVCVQRRNFAASPITTVHDTPCGALPLTGTAQTLHNTFACSEDFPWSPGCGGYQGGDVWASFTVPANGAVTVRANPTVTNQQMAMALYSAPDCSSWESFTEVACGVMPNPVAQLNVTARCLAPGSTVYARIYATSGAQTLPPRFQTFSVLALNPGGSAPTPSNSTPCTAIPVTVPASGQSCTNNTQFSVQGCNSSGAPAPGCGTFGATTSDVWYSFTAPANGTVAIRATSSQFSNPSYNPAVALYTTAAASCNGPLTLVACDDKHGPGQNAYIVKANLVPGRTYYIRVWDETSPGASDFFSLCIESPEPPAGFCYYVIRMTTAVTTGTQTMRVAVGTDTTDHVSSGGEPSQIFLAQVPTGVPVRFLYETTINSQTNLGVAQLGGPEFWTRTAGGVVAGPHIPPDANHLVNPSCGPIPRSVQDCLGGTTICSNANIFGQYTLSTENNIVDLTAANRGCLGDEVRGGRWLLFRATMDGQVSFRIQGTGDATNDDFDFAIWDVGTDGILTEDPSSVNLDQDVCSPANEPIRCSSARTNTSTGLRTDMYGRTSEGTGGFGWVAPLDVQEGHVYILYVANPLQNGQRQFSITWTQRVDANGVLTPDILGDAGCPTLVLPVEFLFVEAEARDEVNNVLWATGTETNSARFEVQRRGVDGDFQHIGTVDAAGHSSSRIDYLFADTRPLPGTSYYRLRQVDLDGQYTYSRIVSVHRSTKGGFFLYPNPAQDLLWAVVPATSEQQIHIQLMDATGRWVGTYAAEPPTGGPLAIPVAGLPPGTYMLRITQGASVWTERFLKR